MAIPKINRPGMLSPDWPPIDDTNAMMSQVMREHLEQQERLRQQKPHFRDPSASEGCADQQVPAPFDPRTHPLYPVFERAIMQAAFGKGQRHGGNATPFFEQPWVHLAKQHGRGFLTGQAAKKLDEASRIRKDHLFEQEMLGAIVYAAMAILCETSSAFNIAGTEKEVP